MSRPPLAYPPAEGVPCTVTVRRMAAPCLQSLILQIPGTKVSHNPQGGGKQIRRHFGGRWGGGGGGVCIVNSIQI